MAEQLRPPPERMYEDEEVGKILKRAAGLHHEQRTAASALSVAEIEAIARDAGIDPVKVRQAIAELEERKRGSSFGETMLGAPTKLSIERIIPGELDPKHQEALVLAIRRMFNDAPGLPSSVGRTLTYLGGSRNAPVEITVTPFGGNTVVRLNVNHANLAGGIFGGIVGGVGGGVGPNIAWLLPFALGMPVAAGIAVGAGFVGLTWMGCRLLYRSIVRGQRQKVHALADELERQVRALI